MEPGDALFKMNDYCISIKNLHTYFRTQRGIVKAVDGVDFSIRRGETLGLVGESGCGKSATALSILRLIQNPPGEILKGEIFFEDLDLLKLGDKQIRRIRGNKISMIFQEPMTSLNPLYTIGNQIAESIRLHKGFTKSEAVDRAKDLLGKVKIENPERRIKEYPHQLSGGMRQRVMIAIALACNPKILIADEPTTALDVTIQAQVLSLITKLIEDFGTSLLLITHDLGVIAEMAQSVAVMYTGKIVEKAGVVDIFKNPKHPYTQGLIKSIPQIDEPIPEGRILPAIRGVVPSLIGLPEGCTFQDRCSLVMDLCYKKEPSLYRVSDNHEVRCWLYGR